MKKNIFLILTCLLIFTIPTEAKILRFINRELQRKAKEIGAKQKRKQEEYLKIEIIKKRKEEREKTCQLLKQKLQQKKLTINDLKKILKIINERLDTPESYTASYKSIVEEIGRKLLSNELKIIDYQIIREYIENPNKKEEKDSWWLNFIKTFWSSLSDYGWKIMRTPTIIPGGIAPGL